jgi:glycosyltransferase involved in cell wall biosynthesis
MKVTYVGPVPPLPGGIAQHGARLIEALRAQGHEVAVHSWRAQYPRLLYPGQQWAPDSELFPSASFRLSWWSPLSWWAAGRAARDGDLLVFPWVTPAQAPAYRVMMSAASRVPTVSIVHNPVPHESRPGDQWLTRWVIRRLRGAVVHSATSRAELLSMAPHLPVIAVPLPPNLPLSPQTLPPVPPYRLLHFGFVRPYKGLEVAIEAVEVLIKRGLEVELTVAGEFWGPVGPWERMVDHHGLSDVVSLRPGYVPDKEVSALLASHHLVVAPYHNATQSAIVPLAHAAGRPVVATRLGGLPEAILEGVNGILAPPGNAVALAQAIERAIGALPALAKGARAEVGRWADVALAVAELGAVSKRST